MQCMLNIPRRASKLKIRFDKSARDKEGYSSTTSSPAHRLLYVRDNGGVREWAGARLKQADGLWKEHGGVVKDKVDEYAPKVR